ncbi:MAG: hypothetical protein PHX18_05910 [Candidatus Gastranaerophilales bacterium]|nr:hypothetical protein [Candidatus Gastranaerophilales bacterium]
MNTEYYVKMIFSKMACSQCGTNFDDDCIDIIRIEDNCAIVRIFCTTCSKNYGIAIIGIERIGELEMPEHIEDGSEPVSYDDVIDAHKFISEMGPDWMKYIPQEKLIAVNSMYSDEE